MKRVFYLASALMVAISMIGFGPIAYANTPRVITGIASWYGPGFHGRRTANGETYNMEAMTAAHKSLPFGTKVEVTNEANGKTVTVRINDRGPYVKGRVIDLSHAAAKQLGMIGAGTASVALRVVAQPETRVANSDEDEGKTPKRQRSEPKQPQHRRALMGT